MDKPTLDGVVAELDRADEHLGELNEPVEGVLEERPEDALACFGIEPADDTVRTLRARSLDGTPFATLHIPTHREGQEGQAHIRRSSGPSGGQRGRSSQRQLEPQEKEALRRWIVRRHLGAWTYVVFIGKRSGAWRGA